MIAALATLAAARGEGPGPEARVATLLDQGMADLHRGRHGRAERAFAEAARLDAADPESHVLRALSLWWRILENRRDSSLDAPFLKAIDAALEAGTRGREGEGAPPPRHRAMTGTAYMLRSHVLSLRREFRAAIRDARAGHSLLTSALQEDPTLLDAHLALGAYNYYADTVSALAKTVRFFLKGPGGDAEAGVRQLRDLADSKARLSTHARLLLAVIEGSRQRRCYAAALADLEAARARHPDSPLVAGALGGMLMRLGRYQEAAGAFASAVTSADGNDEERAHQRRRLRVRHAEAWLSAWRIPEAQAVLGAGAEDGLAGEDERRARADLEDEMAFRRGLRGAASLSAPSPEYTRQVGEALAARESGRTLAALKALREASALEPRQPLPRLLAGEMLLAERRYAEAEDELHAASDLSDGAPPWVAGWAAIDRGLALRALGRERQARAWFEEAGEVKRFRSADRGLYELQAGKDGQPGCAGS